MDRRQFCKSSVLAAAWTLSPRPVWAEPNLIQAASDALKTAGSNAAMAALAGQERVLDPYRHYPSEAGIKDPKTGHSFFFHAHRDDEYGHFHTFSVDQYGAAVHVAMVSVNAQGLPTLLSTTNQWVTGTRYLPAKKMESHIKAFSMSPDVYAQPNLVRFVTAIVQAHHQELMTLYIERDSWLARYRDANKTDPFKDTAHEILSSIPLRVAT
jgi:hypothetical protein